MKYAFLPKNGIIQISKLGLGTKVFTDKIKVDGRIYKHPVIDNPKDIITYAVDSGINLIESASFYSQITLNNLSAWVYDIRKSLMLNCRVGYRIDRDGEFIKERKQVKTFLRREYLLEDVEKLVKTFRTDYIDIVTVCGLENNKEYISDVFDAFVTMKSRGYIRFSGIYLSLTGSDELLFVVKTCDFCQLTYNILNQGFEEKLSKISKIIPIITCAPFANGLLSKKYTESEFFKDNDPRTLIYTKEKLKVYGNYLSELSFLEIKKETTKPFKKSRSFIQGALNFVLQNPNITATIFCVSSLEQLKEVLGVFESEELTQPQIELIKSLYKMNIENNKSR